jgi:hypothetical protein
MKRGWEQEEGKRERYDRGFISVKNDGEEVIERHEAAEDV